MPNEIFFVVATLLALTYAYWNGANDSANTIATLVGTRALSYPRAAILAGVLNMAGPLFTTAVAKTLAKGIVPPERIDQAVIIGGLIGAITWAWLATYKRIPVSITHSLIGGIVGAGIAYGGWTLPQWHILMSKVFLGIALAPFLGVVIGIFVLWVLKWIIYFFFSHVTLASSNRFWRGAQILSASFLSWTHGMNDGQNAIGIIALSYFVAGFSQSVVIEWWMILLGGFVIGLGTWFSGRRVVETSAFRITRLYPIDGFAAQLSSAAILFFKSSIGWPVSTTHVALGGIFGVGIAKGFKNIKQSITIDILFSWVLTIPVAATFGAAGYYITHILFSSF